MSTCQTPVKAYRIFEELTKENIISGDFGSTYVGAFESREAFARKRLDGIIPDDSSVLKHYINYNLYAKDIFPYEYVFVDGHVFEKYTYL